MTEHHSAYDAPVYPADPDCYHDRAHPWVGQFWRSLGTALLCAALIVAAGLAALAMGAG